MMKLANHRRIALLSPKMRWKTGSIVSRLRSLVDIEDDQRQGGHDVDSGLLRLIWSSSACQ